MKFTAEIELCTKRCGTCNRWYSTESWAEWRCGSCQVACSNRLRSTIAGLERSNAALRGALTRRKGKR